MRITAKKLEIDLHIVLPVVGQAVQALAARLAPERPGDAIEQRGFAVAVVAAEAGEADPFQLERGRIGAVAEEILRPSS